MGEVIRFVRRARHVRAPGLGTLGGQGASGQFSENQIMARSRRRTCMSEPLTSAPSFLVSPNARQLTVVKPSPSAPAYARATVSNCSMPDMAPISVILPRLSTAILPNAEILDSGQDTGMDARAKEILRRIDLRLAQLKKAQYRAEKEAGAPDAIRNLRRGFSIPKDRAMKGLARALECDVEWLRADNFNPDAPDSHSAALGGVDQLLARKEGLLRQIEQLQARVAGLDEAIAVLQTPQPKRARK